MRTALNVTLLAVLAFSQAAPAAEQTYAGYTVEAGDVSGQVGQKTMMYIRLTPCDHCRILEAYANKLSRFSSLDGKVAFDQPSVEPIIKGDALLFAVGVTPTAPGRHPINGVLRVGYIDGPSTMNMVSLPLEVAVVGTK